MKQHHERCRLAGAALLSAWLCFCPRGQACNVPVFRYALERWEAEPYELCVFHRGGLTDRALALLHSVSAHDKVPPANLTVRQIDLAATLDEPSAKLWQLQTNAQPPWLVLRTPQSQPETPPVWAGPLDEPGVKALLDSPARRELVARLLKGESAVWVLLESGDRPRDQAAFDLLTTELKKAEQTLELPAPAPDDPPMRADLPLRVQFDVLRVNRQSPEEATFVRLLLHGTSVLGDLSGPVAFPVFGRGRMLAALTGKELTAQVISQVAAFLCGSCSCEVKELNPGKDLMLAANWDAQFGESPPPPVKQDIPTPVIPVSPPGSTQASLAPIPLAVADSRPMVSRRFLVAAVIVAGGLMIFSGAKAFAAKRRP